MPVHQCLPPTSTTTDWSQLVIGVSPSSQCEGKKWEHLRAESEALSGPNLRAGRWEVWQVASSTEIFSSAQWFLLKILAHWNVKTVSQVCAVYIGCFSTFSGSTFAEELKSEVGTRKNTRQRALRHILRHFFPNFGPSCPIWVCEDIFW